MRKSLSSLDQFEPPPASPENISLTGPRPRGLSNARPLSAYYLSEIKPKLIDTEPDPITTTITKGIEITLSEPAESELSASEGSEEG